MGGGDLNFLLVFDKFDILFFWRGVFGLFFFENGNFIDLVLVGIGLVLCFGDFLIFNLEFVCFIIFLILFFSLELCKLLCRFFFWLGKFFFLIFVDLVFLVYDIKIYKGFFSFYCGFY